MAPIGLQVPLGSGLLLCGVTLRCIGINKERGKNKAPGQR